jgi:hypothetical protein
MVEVQTMLVASPRNQYPHRLGFSYRSLIRGGEKGRKLPVDFDLNRPIGAGRADHDLFDQFPNGSVGFGSVVVVGQV